MKYKIVAALGFLATPMVVVAMAEKPILPSCDNPGVIETVKSMLVNRPGDFVSESARLAAGKWECQATVQVRQDKVLLAYSVELVGPGTVRINVSPNPGAVK